MRRLWISIQLAGKCVMFNGKLCFGFCCLGEEGLTEQIAQGGGLTKLFENSFLQTLDSYLATAMSLTKLIFMILVP